MVLSSGFKQREAHACINCTAALLPGLLLSLLPFQMMRHHHVNHDHHGTSQAIASLSSTCWRCCCGCLRLQQLGSDEINTALCLRGHPPAPEATLLGQLQSPNCAPAEA
jgi:hypothetical protein